MDGLIQSSQQRFQTLDHSAREVVIAVIVEHAEGSTDSDEGDACFNQSACQQCALPKTVAAITVTHAIGFQVDAECTLGLTGQDNVQRLLPIMIDAAHRVADIEFALQSIKSLA